MTSVAPVSRGEVERLAQFRPIGLPTALDLGEPADQLGASACGEVLDGLALGLEPEPAGPCRAVETRS